MNVKIVAFRVSFFDRKSNFKLFRSFCSSSCPRQEAPKRFEEIAGMSVTLKNAVSRSFGFTDMTPVQASILSKTPLQKDLVVRAKTGTGKTLGYLLAAAESLHEKIDQMKFDGSSKESKPVSILIVTPTRELATQVYSEAAKLFLGTPLRPVLLSSSTGTSEQMKKLERNINDIVIGTPGRIGDLIQRAKDFKNKISKTQVYIVDEADKIMDGGFEDQMKVIESALGPNKRTILASATFNSAIQELINQTLKEGYESIDFIGGSPTETHLKTRQSVHIVPYSKHHQFLYGAIQEHLDTQKFPKVMVFFPTASIASYFANMYSWIPGLNLLTLHSKMTPFQRSQTHRAFSKAKKAVMFTTDVSARGMDYADVTMVIQYGNPYSREQYIHRVGRTGRAGKEGEAKLILAPLETPFLKVLDGIPVKVTSEASFRLSEDREKALVEAQSRMNSTSTKNSVVGPWLQFYASTNKNILKLTPFTFSQVAKEFVAKVLLMKSPPKIKRTVLDSVGLSRELKSWISD